MSPPLSVEKLEPKSVKIARKTSTSTISSPESTPSKDGPLGWLRKWMEAHTEWIRKNLKLSKLKPVIRCSVVGWVSVVVFVIPKEEFFFGQVWGLLTLLGYRTELDERLASL